MTVKKIIQKHCDLLDNHLRLLDKRYAGYPEDKPLVTFTVQVKPSNYFFPAIFPDDSNSLFAEIFIKNQCIWRKSYVVYPEDAPLDSTEEALLEGLLKDIIWSGILLSKDLLDKNLPTNE